jgi:SAM-dependent methyltransferase
MDSRLNDLLRRALTHYEAGNELVRQAMRQDDVQPVPIQQDWPLAVSPTLIVRPGQRTAATLRARQILEPLVEYLDEADVLDFGCGEGWVAAAAPSSKSVIGYDPVHHRTWEDHRGPELKFTTILEPGPYNFIICHDVLDHVEGPMQAVLQLLANHLKPGGVLYLRVHPWTSRHGAHQYEANGNNLAYWHLTVPEDELARSVVIPSNRVIRPLATYDPMVSSVGLNVIDRRVEISEPELFFDGDIIDRAIQHTWHEKIDREQARKIMAIQHIDYLLRKDY